MYINSIAHDYKAYSYVQQAVLERKITENKITYGKHELWFVTYYSSKHNSKIYLTMENENAPEEIYNYIYEIEVNKDSF